MPDVLTPPLTHGAALRVTVKHARKLPDGTLLLVTGMGSAITVGEDDTKKIEAALKEAA